MLKAICKNLLCTGVWPAGQQTKAACDGRRASESADCGTARGGSLQRRRSRASCAARQRSAYIRYYIRQRPLVSVALRVSTYTSQKVRAVTTYILYGRVYVRLCESCSSLSKQNVCIVMSADVCMKNPICGSAQEMQSVLFTKNWLKLGLGLYKRYVPNNNFASGWIISAF